LQKAAFSMLVILPEDIYEIVSDISFSPQSGKKTLEKHFHSVKLLPFYLCVYMFE